jgi:hypothetical protein
MVAAIFDHILVFDTNAVLLSRSRLLRYILTPDAPAFVENQGRRTTNGAS